jgi:T3SS negative regulator,GrlR
MSIEALWTVTFASNLGASGGGVVIFETDRLFGGDPDYTYVGKYDVSADGKQISADLEISNYSGRLSSVFGPSAQFKIHIDAPFPRDDSIGSFMQAAGYVIGAPQLKIALTLTKRVLLP